MEQEREKDTNQPKANASTSTAAVPVKPNPVKEPAPFVDKEQDFFESLPESDSIGEMIERLSKEYSAQGNPDIDQLIADLQKLAFQERLDGKMTDAEKKKIQKFAEQVGKYYVVDRSGVTIICPKCGQEQKSNRNICFSCSAMFRD